MLMRELESELARWDNLFDPFREFNLINKELFRTLYPTRGKFPPVNIIKDDHKAVVSAEIPGVDPAGIEISVMGKILTINFERKPEDLKEGESYTRKERWHGKFERTIELPFPVQSDKVAAKVNKGILFIELLRSETDKPRKILVTSE